MEGIDSIIYMCLVLPIIPIIFAIRGKKAKQFLIYFVIGISICFVSAQLNTILLNKFRLSFVEFSTTISPINEEILKVLPVLFFALVFAQKGEELLPLAFAIGIGFALFENILILINNINNVTMTWAITRGIGASLMHSACTSTITIGISYVFNNRKSSLEGLIGLFAISVLYHATFNAFIMSKYSFIALLMPILLFIPINHIEYTKQKYMNKGTEQGD